MQIDWSSFFGSLVGIVFGIIFVIGAFLLYARFVSQQEKAEKLLNPQKFSIDGILESHLLENHLHEYIVENFAVLFPNWRIYGIDTPAVLKKKRPLGVKYRTPAGEIDILALDDNNNFVVIELKRKKAPDKVVTQVDRYMAYVERHLAQTRQSVRALIIARSPDKRLSHILMRRPDIEFMTFQWQCDLKLTKLLDESAVIHMESN